MLKLTRLSGILLLSGSLLIGLSSCRGTPKASSPVVQAPVVAEAPAAKPAPSPPPADPYALAIDKADSATTISQSAQSQDDWNLVVNRWQQALQLMKAVPKNSPHHAQTKTKIAEFERNLTAAQQQVARIANPPAAASTAIDLPPRPLALEPSNTGSPAPAPASATASRSSSSPGVYQARIKRRAAGTPVIDVTFNGNQTFEMIVDTGASGTVITEPMAKALGVQIVGKAKVSTASDRNVEVPLAEVDSIAVGGAVVRQVTVAIGQALEIGLLGHDFFSDYDVTIKRDVVEFRLR